jgi:hypothetical protein
MSDLWSGPGGSRHGTPRGRVTAREVILWLDTDDPRNESGTSCTHAEFLEGRLQEVARSTLGEQALREMLDAVRGAPDDPRFADEPRELRETREMLAGIRHDPTLAALLDDPRLIHGRWFDTTAPSSQPARTRATTARCGREPRASPPCTGRG